MRLIYSFIIVNTSLIFGSYHIDVVTPYTHLQPQHLWMYQKHTIYYTTTLVKLHPQKQAS